MGVNHAVSGVARRKRDPVAVLALLVAATSSLGTCYNDSESRAHARTLLRPHVDVVYRFRKPEWGSSGLIFDSSGLGPAVFDDARLYWCQQGAAWEEVTFEELFEKMNLPEGQRSDALVTSLSAGRQIKAGAEIAILGVTFGSIVPKALAGFSKEIRYRVRYHDLFGRSYIYPNRAVAFPSQRSSNDH